MGERGWHEESPRAAPCVTLALVREKNCSATAGLAMLQAVPLVDTRRNARAIRRVAVVIVAAAGAAALIVFDALGVWSPEQWSATAAWVTAAIALAAGLIAVRQLGEARRLRLEQAQPYVAVFMESGDDVDERFVYLVIRNFGTTAAMNVRLEIDPAPQRAAGGGVEDVWLPDCIPVLVPGQEWRTLWDFAPRRAEDELSSRHDATVAFEDSQGKRFQFAYVLDWSVSKERMHVTTYGIHHAAKALRDIDRKLGRWQESVHGGLAVTVRDGDAKDSRDPARRQDAPMSPGETVEEGGAAQASEVPAGPWTPP